MLSFTFNPFTGNFDVISQVSLGAVGSSPNANAATITNQVLILQPASASFPGLVTTGTQTFAGAKTFTSTITGTTTGNANTALSNLSSVAINTTLLPGVTNTIDLGARFFTWNNAWINTISDHVQNGVAINIVNRTLLTDTGVLSADWNTRYLAGADGTQSLAWGAATGTRVAFSHATPNTIGYFDASTILTSIATGATGNVLTVSGGIPVWAAPATSGTVTSVALTVPSFLSVSGSPITSSGTLAVTLSGTALPFANGGTGATTAAAAFNGLNPMTTTGDMIYESATNVASRLPIGSTGNVLTVVGGVPAWAAPATSGTVTSVSVVSANGFAGTVANATTTPAITLTTTLTTPVVAANGTALIAGTTTGTGSTVVLATSPTLVTPDLGTPSAVILTNGTGLPLTTGVTGILPFASGGTGQTTGPNAFNALSPMTTVGDIIVGGTSGAGTRLGRGTANQALTMLGSQTTPSWNDIYQAQFANYIEANPNFEVDTTGYAAYADAAATSPVDGTGGSPTVTITRTTSTPLFQTGSGLFTKDAANRQGQGFSYDFTIDSAIATSGTPCTISGFYSIASGTYASGDMTIWIYDVTNAQLIQPSASSILNITGSGPFQCEFQPNTTSTSYRLIFHVTTTSASAYTLKFDNIFVRANTYNPGSVITNWVSTLSITPTGFGTVAAPIYWSRRVGDTLQMRGYFTMGTPSGTAMLTMPSGLTIDSTKMGTATRLQKVGISHTLPVNATSATVFATKVSHELFYDGSDTANLYLANGVGNQVDKQYDKSVAANIAPDASGDNYNFDFAVPITGWGTNQVLSSDTDTRIVAAIVTGDPASATSGNPIIVPTVIFDSHAGYNATTGRYTVPVPGIYKIYGALQSASAATTLTLYKNAVSTILAGNLDSNGEGTYAGSMNCNAGDLIDVRPGGTVDATSFTINIERTSGPAQVAASESINARYFASATAISGSLATISWTTKDFDSHNAMSAGTYSVPAPGKYEVNAALLITGTVALNNNLIVEIQKNGVVVSRFTEFFAATLTDGKAAFSDLINCVTGDTLRIQASSSVTGPSIVASNFDNYFSIFRTGN